MPCLLLVAAMMRHRVAAVHETEDGEPEENFAAVQGTR